MKLRTLFGIMPPDLGFSSEKLTVETLPPPKRAVLFIARGAGQGNDNTGIPTVSVGDSVTTGQALTGDDAPALSSVTGKVSGLRDVIWTNGEAFTVIEIETTTSDEFAPDTPDMVLPTADTVIVNGLESDLCVTVSRQVLLDATDDVRAGVALLAERGVKQVILAVPQDLRGTIGDVPGATVVGVPAVHPNGHPEILARLVAKSVNISGRTETISAEALAGAARSTADSGRPSLEKLVTFTGPLGAPERIFKVRIGTTVGDILDAVGVTPSAGSRLVLGGALTGRAAFGLDFPIMEDIDAVILQGPELTANISSSQCINCGKCVEICPNRLPVNLLSRFAEYSMFEKAEELDAERCIECGLCAYVCTAHRPIVQFIQYAKNAIRKIREEENQK